MSDLIQVLVVDLRDAARTSRGLRADGQPAGVTSAPDPLIDALARFSARTVLVPRTNPVAETAAAISADSPAMNGWN